MAPKTARIRVVCKEANNHSPAIRKNNGKSLIRALVVDDFQGFREFAVNILSTLPNLKVIGQVETGAAAIEFAQAHGPDLVVLDIGLPDMCGLVVAEKLRELVPQARIVFLSQHSGAEVIAAAMRLGAVAYVVKTRAYTDFPRSIQAVLAGRQFVSEAAE